MHNEPKFNVKSLLTKTSFFYEPNWFNQLRKPRSKKICLNQLDFIVNIWNPTVNQFEFKLRKKFIMSRVTFKYKGLQL